MNASVLESMKLVGPSYRVQNKKWIQNQRKKLQIGNRASSAAQIEFAIFDCFSCSKDIHEVSDPFECVL